MFEQFGLVTLKPQTKGTLTKRHPPMCTKRFSFGSTGQEYYNLELQSKEGRAAERAELATLREQLRGYHDLEKDRVP